MRALQLESFLGFSIHRLFVASLASRSIRSHQASSYLIGKMATASALFSTSSLKAAGAQPYTSMEGKLDPSLLRGLRDMGMECMTPVQSKVLGMPSLTADW